jgi:hypothetical protein
MKQIILMIILLCCLNTSDAQLGITAGGTAADQNYQQTGTNGNTKLGGHAGIAYNFNFGRVLRVSPEVFLNQSGSKTEYYTSFLALADSLKLNKVAFDYVGLYFPIRLSFGPNEENGFYLSGAAYGDYIINDQVTYETGKEERATFNQARDKYDLGWRVAIGFVVDNVGLEIGYNKGLENIAFTSAQRQAAGKQNEIVSNRGLTVSLKFGFR